MTALFARVYAGLLLTVSYGSIFLIADRWDWQIVPGGIVAAFFFAIPVLIITALGFAACGRYGK
jgi:hypothetical protein